VTRSPEVVPARARALISWDGCRLFSAPLVELLAAGSGAFAAKPEGPVGADLGAWLSFVSLPKAGDDFIIRHNFELSITENLVVSVSRAVGLSLGSAPMNPSSGTTQKNRSVAEISYVQCHIHNWFQIKHSCLHINQ
jgi:hypothetical protein